MIAGEDRAATRSLPACSRIRASGDPAAEPQAGRDCPLCGGSGSPVGLWNGCALRTCCGCLLAWAWPSAEEYEQLYRQGTRYPIDEQLLEGQQTMPQRYPEYVAAAQARLCWLIGQVGFIGPWERVGVPLYDRTLLDVGAGCGAMVHVARRFGFRSEGLDPNGTLVSWAWNMNQIALALGGWEKIAGDWTLLVNTDVIEHLLRPLAFLQRAAAHARYVYVETPDWPGKGEPVAWPARHHIRPRQHVCLFSEAALAALAGRAGLKVMQVTRPIPGKLGMLLAR